jgi:hypothetical protein
VEIGGFLWMIRGELCTTLWDQENVGNSAPKALREWFPDP